MNQVDLPDDDVSLTASSISQLSQSPFNQRFLARTRDGNVSPNINVAGTSLQDAIRSEHFNSTEGSHRHVPPELTTLGKSDESGTVAGHNQMSGTLNRMILGFNGTRGTQYNGTGGSHVQDTVVVASDEEEEVNEPPLASRPRRTNSPDFNRNTGGYSYREHDEVGDSSSNPMNLTATTYDLTVSHTHQQNNNNVSQRNAEELSSSSIILNQPIYVNGKTAVGGGTSTNRTFADSVINHQQQQQYSGSSNHNTYRQHQHPETKRYSLLTPRGQSGEEADHDDESDLYSNERQHPHQIAESNSSEEEDAYGMRRKKGESSGDDEGIEPSEMSAVDSFAQTQYSKFSKYQHSKLGHSRFGGGNNQGARLAQDQKNPSSVKTPQVNRKVAITGGGIQTTESEALSLTPSTNNEASRWGQLTQKSYLTANNASSSLSNNLIKAADHSALTANNIISSQTPVSQYANNRTSTSDNPLLNRLTTNIPQVLNTNRTAENASTQENQMIQPQIRQSHHYHNRSLQRDPELERALEEDSENQTLKRASSPGGTLEDSKGSQQALPPANPLQAKLSNLKVQLATVEAQRVHLADSLEQKDQALQQLQHHALSLETQVSETQEHLKLLQAKCKDDSTLARLRATHLEHARRTIAQLQSELLMREERLEALEREARTREADERALYVAQKEEIGRLLSQCDTLQALLRGREREALEGLQKAKLERDKSEEAYQAKIREMDMIIDQLRKSQKTQQKQIQTAGQQHDQEIKALNLKINELQSLNSQMGQQTAQMGQERDRYQAEMKQYKERARVLDQEIEQLRAFEHNSIKQRQQQTSNEYEIKNLKELYEKKIQKGNEDIAKKSTLIRELEHQVALAKEEAKRVAEFNNLQENIRFLFVIGSDEDLLARLTKISMEIREIPSLQREIEKLKGRLEEATRQLATLENTSNQSMYSVRQSSDQSQMSNFLRTLLLEKDKQIDQLRLKCEEVDDKLSLQLQEQVKYDSQIKLLKSQNNDLLAQIDQMHLEVQKTRESQSKAETQASELKEKLRVIIREQQEERIQMQFTASQTSQQSKQASHHQPLDQSIDPKYQEFLEYILSIALVEDPLDALLQDNTSSKSLDHARTHLQTQLSLVSNELSTLKLQQDRANQQHKQDLDLLLLEKQSITDTLERTLAQQRDVEDVNRRLRAELDKAAVNLRKALKASQVQKPQQPANNGLEIERVMMGYEDLLARQTQNAQELQSNEVHHMRRCSAVQTEVQEQNDQSIMVFADMLQEKTHEAELFEVTELLTAAQRDSELLKQELDSKNEEIEQLKTTIDIQQQQMNEKQSAFLQDIEALRAQVTDKSAKLDLEYETLVAQKNLVKDEALAYQRELDRKQAERQLALETDFFNKLKILESELRSSQSKEASIATIYQQMQQQTQSQMKEMADEHQNQLQQLKQAQSQAISDLKAKHQREVKAAQQEVAVAKKASEDKAAKRELDYQTQIDLLEQGFKEKLEAEKKDKVKAHAQLKDKLKAEQRNALDALKNEHARAKAEFEREKKQLLQIQESEIQKQKREFEDRIENECRALKDKLDKQWKKRVDEAHQDSERRIDQIQNDMAALVTAHKEEMRKERDRVEIMLREQIRQEVKGEVTSELEKEYQAEVAKMVEAHGQEIERIKQKYQQEVARVEKASQLPKQVETRFVEVQCDIPQQPIISDKQKELFFEDSINEDIDNTGLVVINNPHNQSSSIIYDNDNIVDYARQNNSYHANNDKVYIQQLKTNYEAEMERQLQVFEVQLVQKQQSTLRIFEELMTLEFDKILQSIYLKQDPQRLESRRKEINGLIQDILARNDDRREQQMRSSMDALKKKINQTLKVFKDELDNKFNKKMQLALQQQQSEQKQHQHSRDVSDIVSTSCKHPFSQIASEDGNLVFLEQKSQPYSPRNEVANHLEQFAQEQAQQIYQQEGFFVETESGQQLLRKVAPMPNTQGVLMVEVDKVCRDLQMLVRTMTHAKFYRIFVEDDQEASIDENDEQRGSSHEASLQRYRILLNQVMRIIVQLNQGADLMTKANELYRVKLTNAELRDHIKGIMKQIDQQSASAQAEAIINFYLQNTQPNEMLSRDGQSCLSELETCQFAISKQHLKILQLKDLFMVKNQVNRNILEVNKLCGQYIQDNPTHKNSNELMQSQYSPSQVKIVPEMLSPEETAQLMASVFQRITNNPTFGSTTQINAATQQSSFFQTFLSNEANIRCAENFIQRYREQLSQTHRSNDLPRQLPRGHHLYASNDDTNSRATTNQYRSHSGSSQGPVDTRRVAQSTVTSNVFLKNVASAKSLNINGGNTTANKSIASTAAVSKANQPYQSIQLRGATQTNSSGSLFQNNFIPPFQAKENYNTLNLNTTTTNLGNTLDELSNVQSNLNMMIEKANNNKGSSGVKMIYNQ